MHFYEVRVSERKAKMLPTKSEQMKKNESSWPSSRGTIATAAAIVAK